MRRVVIGLIITLALAVGLRDGIAENYPELKSRVQPRAIR